MRTRRAPVPSLALPPLQRSSLLLERNGLLAGLALVLIEIWILRGADAQASAALQLVGAMVILFSIGLLTLALRIGLALGRLPGDGHPWRRATLGALLCLPLIVVVSLRLFSGTGVAGTSLATVGPLIAIPLLTGATLAGLRITIWAAGLARRMPTFARRLLALPALLICGLLIWTDRVVYPNQYAYLHWLTLLATALGLMAVGWLLRVGRPARWWHWFAPALLLATGPAFVTSTVVSLDSERRKQALLEHSHSAGRLVDFYRGLLDRDGDGHSVIFGDRDCDDGDPAVHPLARDVPGNGRDEDCDGRDAVAVARPAAPATTERAAATGTGPLDRAAFGELAARWRGRPAVSARLRQTAGYSVVLLVIDALRGSLLAETAENRANHPNLMRLVGASRNFPRAFSPGAGTDIGMASLLTGQLAPLARRPETLLRAAADGGLVTHGVFQREVDRWLGRAMKLDGLGSKDLVINDAVRQDVGDRPTARKVTDHGLAFLRRTKEQRFLLWLHYFDLHEYHQIDPARLEPTFRAPAGLPLYRRLLAYTDGQVGRVLATLEQLGLAERTIVVLASDHGEGLAETPRLPQNHGDVLFNPLIHVALSIRIPGLAGARVDQPVTLLDLSPTLRELLGLGAAPSHGLSLVPWLIDAPSLHARSRLRRPILLYEAKQRGVIVWPWKLLVWWDRGLTELYNLDRDFGERNNLADDLPRRKAELAAVINRFALPRVDRLAAIRKQRRRSSR